uniref:RNase H type-1 domain-containing protein n=1 Tax=Cannabis sativa TaxID=3483 RepID=A0A803PY23_CANSA
MMEKADVEALICVMWSIWNDRNKVLHGGSQRDPILIASFALTYIEHYRSAKGISCKKLHQPKSHQADPTHQIPHQQGFHDQNQTADNLHGLRTPNSVIPLGRINCQQVGEFQNRQARLNANQHQQTTTGMRHQPNISAVDDTVQLQRPLDDIIWKPPDMNMLQMNVDAATNFKNQTLGIREVVRNYEGEVIAVLQTSSGMLSK